MQKWETSIFPTGYQILLFLCPLTSVVLQSAQAEPSLPWPATLLQICIHCPVLTLDPTKGALETEAAKLKIEIIHAESYSATGEDGSSYAQLLTPV